MPSSEENAYLAGIIDGEGYVGVSRSKNSRNTYLAYIAKIIITTTDTLLVKWLISKYNFSFTRMKIRRNGLSKKPCYQCYLQNDKSLDILKLVYPYLIIKKHRADLLIKEYPNKNVRNSNKREFVYNRLTQLTKEN